MRIFFAILAASVLLSSCATQLSGPTEIVLTTPFNPADFAWASVPGNNTITGNAVLRTKGGETRTCAALPAVLIPVTAYSTERSEKLYGSSDHGYYSYYDTLNRKLPVNTEYAKLTRVTTCDSQGNFTFSNLPDGDFFTVALVTWNVPGAYAPEGGYVMLRVHVHGGETQRVVLTQR